MRMTPVHVTEEDVPLINVTLSIKGQRDWVGNVLVAMNHVGLAVALGAVYKSEVDAGVWFGAAFPDCPRLLPFQTHEKAHWVVIPATMSRNYVRKAKVNQIFHDPNIARAHVFELAEKGEVPISWYLDAIRYNCKVKMRGRPWTL